MSAIVLPNLTQWTESHLSAILKATNQADFDAAFDAFLAKHVTIVFNGVKISRDDLKSQWQGEKFDEQGATVSFNGAVAVPASTEETITAGFVGVFFTATIAEKILVLGAPAERTITSSLNVNIEQDQSLHRPTGPVRGFFDGRRVTSLNQVVLDKADPIHIQAPVNA